MSQVELDAVSKMYGQAMAVDNVALTIREGEFLTILGASGSGKTTCLRMVAGFVMPSSGRILIGGVDVTALPPQKRNTAMVFQQYALFPHLSVAQNVGFGLKVRGAQRASIKARVDAVLDLMQLSAFASRMPAQLSGGQKQRVALARAVVLEPEILLLDEPLGALDRKLRDELQIEIKRVQTTLGVTTLFVTHDQGEALAMSDRIAVMDKGRVVQVDAPAKLYQEPVNGVVARFIGRMTLIPVTVAEIVSPECIVRDDGGNLFRTHHWPTNAEVGSHLLLCIRPEIYRLNGEAANMREVLVERTIYQGANSIAHCRDEAGASHIVDIPLTGPQPASGDVLTLSWGAESCRAIWPE